LLEEKRLDEKLATAEARIAATPRRLAALLELAGSAYLSYRFAPPAEKRDLITEITSNRLVEGKNLAITLKSPFQEVAERFKNSNGALERKRTSRFALPKTHRF